MPTPPPPSPFRAADDRYDPRGFATGLLVANAIQQQHDLVLQQWRWRYGTHFRSRPFVPHEQLNGLFMTSMGTLDGYYPGDHRGCLCLTEPIFVRRGTREFVPVAEAVG